MASSNGVKALETLDPVSNDAAEEIDFMAPYMVRVRIEGTAAFLCHRWSNEAVAEKSSAAKNSKAKKSDNVERAMSIATRMAR